ncbi:hypothetical protein [Shimia biformata]|uniref:hypothetical protein n=1 Tax=Shimia biformata TaxID=1294299 RepID=UPI00195060DC|nr:hypothetical protein [Shimia biformata]
MARLKLKPDVHLKDLGYAILNAAAAKFARDGSRVGRIEHEILDMFVDKDRSQQIYFHYDDETEIHVVVPYLGDKLVERDQSKLDEFEIVDIAAECMGSIVIRGCGQ